MQRIEVNVLTGEQTIIDLTTEEIAEAQAQAAQVQTQDSNTTPTLEQIVQEQQAMIAQLQAAVAALQGTTP
jgi:multidrug resistance efflux pump